MWGSLSAYSFRWTTSFQAGAGDPKHFGAEPDPHLWQTDPDPDPIPILLLSSVTLRMQKKTFFFSYNLPAGTLPSVLKIYFLLKFSVKFLVPSTLLWEKKRIRMLKILLFLRVELFPRSVEHLFYLFCQDPECTKIGSTWVLSKGSPLNWTWTLWL